MEEYDALFPMPVRWRVFRERFAERLEDIFTTPGVSPTTEELRWPEWVRAGLKLPSAALDQLQVRGAFIASLQDAHLHQFGAPVSVVFTAPTAEEG